MLIVASMMMLTGFGLNLKRETVPNLQAGATYEFRCAGGIGEGVFVEVSSDWIRFDLNDGQESWYRISSCQAFWRRRVVAPPPRGPLPDYDIDPENGGVHEGDELKGGADERVDSLFQGLGEAQADDDSSDASEL